MVLGKNVCRNPTKGRHVSVGSKNVAYFEGRPQSIQLFERCQKECEAESGGIFIIRFELIYF